MRFRNFVFIAAVGLATNGVEGQGVPVRATANLPTVSYLGVGIRDVDADRAKILKLPEVAGVEITMMDPVSPAAAAGLKIGDVMVVYDGRRVEDIDQTKQMLRETPAGKDVRIQIYRNGAAQTVVAKIGSTVVGPQMPAISLGPSAVGTIPDMALPRMTWRLGIGADVEALEAQMAEYFGVKDGLLVRSVMKGSAAEKAGLKAGDVIVRVGDAKVATPADLDGNRA